ncbi:hypothetical protein F7725_019010 [Dissostichus mawsoni]|uniref:Transposase Helix-turn-helix domain-containing protein n=1 Tax=Dissostichus mawsoni TaxID=36200 RepID=A0A7J5XU25_DISMA|nr:hypothetical protein F7725_019010 [Dissostichus mawsoni]
MEEEAACLMTEEEAGPSTQAAANEGPQPLPENAEEQATTVEEKLQSQQRRIMQLEIQLEESKAKQSYCRDKYSASQLSEKVLRMETGLPDRDTFSAVCEYVARFEGSITYPEGWFPKALSLEDQVFMTLMKLRNYTHLHLAALFHCGESTVRNVIVTFIEVLHKLLFKDIMSTVPSREKNKTSLPSSFRHMQNCRMIVDCTDIKIAIPKQMDIQKETYSAYRGMHSFKLLLGKITTTVTKLWKHVGLEKVLKSQQVRLPIVISGYRNDDTVFRSPDHKVASLSCSEVKLTLHLVPGHFTSSTAEDPTRPSGDAPNNPVWESHKPDSWTCIWVAVVNALTPSHSFIVPHCTDKTPSRACCCPSTLAIREAVTRFDLRTAPKLLAVNLPFLNKCQFGGSHLNCPLLLLRQCHACHNCLRSLMPNRLDDFRNSKCFQAVVFLFWLGGEKPRNS